MSNGNKPHATGRVKAGDVSQRVGVEAIEARGVDVGELVEKLIDAAGAEFTTYYYYTILRMYLAGHEDYKEICEDARLEDRAHFELITPRIYELGGTLPYDIRAFADRAGCPDAYLPGTQQGRRPMSNPFDIATNVTPAQILEVLLEAERCAIRTWSEICDLTFDQSASVRYYEEDRRAGFALICTGRPRSDLHLRPGAVEEMRAHRDASHLPVPRGTRARKSTRLPEQAS
jgi:ferritin-like protein